MTLNQNPIINFPQSGLSAEPARADCLLARYQEQVELEQGKVNLLQKQITVLERTPSGGFFTPDFHSAPGRWNCIAWRDQHGINHRTEDISFPKCLARHLLSQPSKVLGLVAVIALGVGTVKVGGAINQYLSDSGTIDLATEKITQGFYRVLETGLEIRDKHF